MNEIEMLAQRIWDYCRCPMPLVKSNVIVVLCSHDLRIAEYAANLYLQGLAPLLIFSGGLSEFTSRIYSSSEAAAFREAAIQCGVPTSAILIEDRSTNTQENLEFTWKLLENCGPLPEKMILVQKPNMLRRVLATAQKLFPRVEFVVTSHDISFADAQHEHLTREMLIHELVGDIERIPLYAEKQLIVPQVMDPDAWDAFLKLKNLGYVGNLSKG